MTKYWSISCRCLQGHVHQSRLEAGHCDFIANMKGANKYKTQVKYPLAINGKHICNHYVDFEVEHADGTVEVIESKGFETAIWRLKRKMFEACYPDIKYTVWRK